MTEPVGIRPIYRTNQNIVAVISVVGLLLVLVPGWVFGPSSLKSAYGALVALPLIFIVFGAVALRARVIAKRVAACRTSRGRVTEILDGSLVAAAQVETEPVASEAFVARFAVVAEDGSRIVVEPGPAHLVDLAEINVGDEVQIQGPHTTRGEGTYRGTEPTLVYRGTEACPLILSRT